jgi:hypothetical protein
MRPPLPRDRAPPPPRHRHRHRPAEVRRTAAPNHTSATPSTPAAHRSSPAQRGSGQLAASTTRAVQIGRTRIGLRRPPHLDGDLHRRSSSSEFGDAECGTAGIAPPWRWVHTARPSGAAPRPPPTPSAASASLGRPVSRPTSLLPSPPSAPRPATVNFDAPPVRPPFAVSCRRSPLPIRHTFALPTPHSAPPLWASPPPPSYSCHRAVDPSPVRPRWFPHPLAAPPPSAGICAPNTLLVRAHPAPLLRTGRNMSRGGDDLFGGPYSGPDHFSSGFYPAPPPFSPPRMANNNNLGPGHGFQGLDLNNPYNASSAASTHGGMAGPSQGNAGYGGTFSTSTSHAGFAGPSHGYGGTMSAARPFGGTTEPSHGYGGPMSAATPLGGMAAASHAYLGYGGPPGFFQMPVQGGGQHMFQPPRHSTSSMSIFGGGPQESAPPNQLPAMLPSYGDILSFSSN